ERRPQDMLRAFTKILAVVALFTSSGLGCSDSPGRSSERARTGLAAAPSADDATDGGATPSGFKPHGITENGLSTNGIGVDALSTIGLTENGLTQSGLVANGLVQNGLTENGIANAFSRFLPSGRSTNGYSTRSVLEIDPNAIRFLKHVYACAMPPGANATITINGTPQSFDGSIGLAPEW